MMTMLLKSILIFIFVVISISDWRTHKIPDRWNAGILLVAVLLALVDSSVSWQERILVQRIINNCYIKPMPLPLH